MIMMALARRKWLALVAVVLVLVAGGVAWRVLRVQLLVNIGTGYVAEQTCACLFVSGRTLDSCVGDLDPLAQKLISIHPGAAEVTAKSFVLGSATARYEKGFGCSLRD